MDTNTQKFSSVLRDYVSKEKQKNPYLNASTEKKQLCFYLNLFEV